MTEAALKMRNDFRLIEAGLLHEKCQSFISCTKVRGFKPGKITTSNGAGAFNHTIVNI